MKKYLLIVPLLFLLVGCSERIGDFTLISTKNVDIGKNYIKVNTDAIGKSTKQIIIFIPTGTPSIKDAVDDLLKKSNGDLVTNAVIHYNWYYIPYVFGEFSYEIQGDVYSKVLQKVSAIEKDGVVNNNLPAADLQNADLVFTAEQLNGELQLNQISKNKVSIDSNNNLLVVKK